MDPNTKEAYLARLREEVGEEAVPFLEAVRHGDCQRRLVWDRIQELHQESK